MAGRFLSTSFLASMAVAVLAHVGVITGFLLLAPAGGLSGQLAEQADIMITLVELAEPEPQPDMAENTQAVPEPRPAAWAHLWRSHSRRGRRQGSLSAATSGGEPPSKSG